MRRHILVSLLLLSTAAPSSAESLKDAIAQAYSNNPAIAAARARVPLVGASIAGFAPASPAAAVDDLGTILRVVGALA